MHVLNIKNKNKTTELMLRIRTSKAFNQIRLLLILILVCLQVTVFAQQTGMPFITNYPPEVYKSTSQNWAIVQDKRGVMFFGNSNGILEFDGIEWRFIPMTTTVRSLTIDSSGLIFVGSKGDFGYLHPDSLGRYKYLSLKEKIPIEHRDFNDVWNIFVSGSSVFFQTFEKIFIYQNRKFKVLYPEKSFHLAFMVNNSLYVREAGKGLMILKNDSLQILEGGERFADEKNICNATLQEKRNPYRYTFSGYIDLFTKRELL
ncbi:MAG: hypothetical protein HC905_00360 [Bacteroidales bacterium]|nr:hypothetical protein [Bacteroidales bacterium]